MKLFLPVIFFNFIFFSEALDLAGAGHVIEKYGFPTVITLLIWFFFSRQIADRHREQREFWAENNQYLRQLIRELQNNYCGFKQGQKEHDKSGT